MAFVYLIGDRDKEGVYKIGSTRKKDPEKRLKQLQTGNGGELFFVSTYETDKPFRLEKMLHRKYNKNNVLNEWFEIEDINSKSFTEECKKCEEIFDSLKGNPFFKQNK